MHRYLYILNAQRPFIEAELGRIKDEVCRLFKCTEISVAGGTRFTIHSPLGPSEVDSVAHAISKKFGAQFSGGGRID